MLVAPLLQQLLNEAAGCLWLCETPNLSLASPPWLLFSQPAFKPEEHRANLFFSIEKVKFLKDLVWVWGAFRYTKLRAVEN